MRLDETHQQSLMDNIYTRQRYIYDISRKYYLLGRDKMISELRPPNHGHVLEIGCGTGRNLVVSAQSRRRANYYGIDISNEMLKSANKLIQRSDLQSKIQVANGDATRFDPESLFGIKKFDRIFISYSISMIPDWRAALDEAVRHLSENGSLHIVDFGQQSMMPKPFKIALFAWLKLFRVKPRVALQSYLENIAEKQNRGLVSKKLFRDYTCYYVLGPIRR